MATRAIDASARTDSVCHRLESWLTATDHAFIARWDELAQQAVEPNAFNESWFLRPALEQFDPFGKVRLFTLWDDYRLCGMIPLGVRSKHGRWPVPNFANWMHHNAFLGTPLVRAGYEAVFWETLLEKLDAKPGQALFAHFQGLACDGPMATALVEVSRRQQRRCAAVHYEHRALLDGNLSPDAYFETAVRGKKRKELRRQKNRLAEEGSLSFARHADASRLDAWAEEFLALENRGWKGRNGSALACAPQTRLLFKKALRGAAAVGKLERLDLRLDGKPLAMLVNFLCAPGSFSFKTAFDEDYARFSPGVLLQIENLALLDHREIDWCDSCAVEGHPMIDSLWTGRRAIGRYSVAIGGSGRRAVFGALLTAELARSTPKQVENIQHDTGGDME